MRAATVSVLDEYYADLLGTQPRRLWRELTVNAHRGRLSGYPGYYVVWRDAGVHVSAPEEADPSVVRWLRDQPAGRLQDPAWWRDFAAGLGLRAIGPSTHAYLDEDPGPADGVEAVDEEDLLALRGLPRDANVASLATARRLGFRPWCPQLAVR